MLLDGGKNTGKIALFGSFYPNSTRAANTTNSFAYLFSLSNIFNEIIVIGNKDSNLPVFIDGKISLIKSWSPDDYISLLKSFITMIRIHDTRFFFNIYMTAFGRKKVFNFMGLLLPTILSVITRNKAIVYMHNFVETQNIEGLGYKANILTKATVHIVEKLLTSFTSVLVPLPSMAEIVNNCFGSNVKPLFIPYLETAFQFQYIKRCYKDIQHADRIPRVLLFGSWGPQKDLLGILSFLTSNIAVLKGKVEFVVAGSINVNYSYYLKSILEYTNRFPKEFLTFLMNPPEESLPELFLNSDCLLLPYNATGGQSGVLQMGAFYDLPVIAYRLPQLVEQARILGAKVEFIEKNEPEKLLSLILRVEVRELPTYQLLQKRFNTTLQEIKDALRYIIC